MSTCTYTKYQTHKYISLQKKIIGYIICKQIHVETAMCTQDQGFENLSEKNKIQQVGRCTVKKTRKIRNK